jgi:hypothetical protein
VKRTFSGGSGANRRLVVIEVSGARVGVLQKRADGGTKRDVKELGSEAEARAECERLARDLLSRGYAEQAGGAVKAAKPAAVAAEPAGASHAFDDVEPAGPVLPRRAAPAAPAAEAEPKKKKSGAKKKKKKAQAGDALDKRVLFGIAAVGLAILGVVGYVVYDGFIKPPTIVGNWQGTMLEFEIGKPIIRTEYALLLDEKKQASMTLQEKFTSVGTYAVKGNRLKLTLKDEDGEPYDREYRISLGHATMDLYDPSTGKQVVQLIRFHGTPAVQKPKGPAEAPKDLAADAAGDVDKAADERIASVAFAPKDNAFRLRHPAGWEVETGSRPDNSYSWANFTSGSAKIAVTADLQGSLISGSDTARDVPEGSELAPVHVAHEHHAKAVAEEFGDYKESKPTLFKGSGLGEGRIASFTASGGGLFGSKLRGYRVTLLTNDRRVTVLCQAPAGEFEKLKPTFLAVSRSLSR